MSKFNVNLGKDCTSEFDKADIESSKTVAGLTYFLFFLPFLAAPNSKFARFHANQSLVLLISYIVGLIIVVALTFIVDIASSIFFFLFFLNIIPGIAKLLVSGCIIYLFVLGLINGFTGKAKEAPVVGFLRIIK